MTPSQPDQSTLPLPGTPEGIARGADLLRSGALVGFPTETVYGLGVRADDDAAVARLYAAKGRPSFNPLIVHVPDLAAAGALVDFTPEAEALAGAFWPGALTLVLPLKRGAPSDCDTRPPTPSDSPCSRS